MRGGARRSVVREVRFATSLLLAAYTGACGCHPENLVMPPRNEHPDPSPTPLDYTDDRLWAALPGIADGADVLPEGEVDGQAGALVDMFFIHPTTYYGRRWNQPIDDESTNGTTDRGPMRNQASAFNSVAAVYAPRYRQATLYAFIGSERVDESLQAVDNAYGDVEHAFDEFLARIGPDRPFLVASHSQGSWHALRLVASRISGSPLRDRFVAAYIIGALLPELVFERSLPDIPLCAVPDQTGCIVTWNTVIEGEGVEANRIENLRYAWTPEGYTTHEGRPFACVNAISFRTDGEPAPREMHAGGVRFEDGSSRGTSFPRSTGARCGSGLMEASADLRSEFRGLSGRETDLHVTEYPLFYLDMRRNAALRVAGFGAGP